jgi:hypothetical protein
MVLEEPLASDERSCIVVDDERLKQEVLAYMYISKLQFTPHHTML